ncbi:DMT family transporter [Alteromonas oceani]|jgi:drug/metabolite transporter (DMT)-like permease|uniref:DMT family transporter n=1 Tax=Alteromonas oceani TaxID=2071609 RepID=A0ABV7JVP9_9ALTE|nr:DMT family transporter [Alteromonas oceani]|tara:strand:+ start:5167 stop:6042 length:876 start_codon:yes stop_codon:yes gene_type:complete
MDPVKKSLVTLHLAVVLLGGTGLFSKIIPLNAIDITLGRSLFACLALCLFVRAGREHLRLERRLDYFIAIGLGVLMAAHWATYFASMQYAGVSVGMIAMFTFPVITVLLEPLFEKTRLAWQDMLSALVVVIGIVLIVPEISLDNDVTLGVGLGVISAVLYAVRNLSLRKYFSHYSGARSMAWQTLIIVLCLLPFSDLTSTQQDTSVWLLLLALGTAFTALPHALVANSLAHLRAKTFSLIACMQPFYGVIFAIILLNESPGWQTLLGGILVTSASIYETVNTHKSASATNE